MSSLPQHYPSPGQAESGVALAAERSVTMAARLWGIDFEQIFPWTVDGVRVTHERLADVLPFIGNLFPETFNQGGQWLQEPMTEAKRRFGEEMDVFVFRDGDAIIGVAAGHPSDWSTYYWRAVAVLPEYRGKHLLTRFSERFFVPLRAAGVRRIELDTCPANRAIVQLVSSQGFIVTSTLTSERWGLSLRFTKFLDEEAERVYARQFLDVPNNRRHERSPP